MQVDVAAEREGAGPGQVAAALSVVPSVVMALLFLLPVFAATPGPVRAQQTEVLRLRLGDAVSMAAEQSAAVEAAGLRSRRLEARLSEERGKLLPRVDVSGMGSTHTMNTGTFGIDFPSVAGQAPLFDPKGERVGPIKLVSGGARISQTLFDWSVAQSIPW